MAYDRQWLRDQMASQLRDGALGSVVDDLINMSIAKISIVLESQYNEQTTEYTITGGSMSIPNTMNTVRGVSYQGDAGTFSLRSVPSHYMNTNPEPGYPATYSIKGNTLHIDPYANGEYDITYFSNMTLGDAADSTLDALEAYPYMFREAALAEGYAWKENIPGAEAYERKFLGGVQEINRVSQRLRQGDAPAQRAV